MRVSHQSSEDMHLLVPSPICFRDKLLPELFLWQRTVPLGLRQRGSLHGYHHLLRSQIIAPASQVPTRLQALCQGLYIVLLFPLLQVRNLGLRSVSSVPKISQPSSTGELIPEWSDFSGL